MASKRPVNHEKDYCNDEKQQKRMRSTPSFASVVEMVLRRKTLSNVVELLLRKVVQEEVEQTLRKIIPTLSRSPSLRIQAPEPVILKFIFANKCLPKVFTSNKIRDINNQPLQLLLVEQNGDQITPFVPRRPIKIEIVTVYGDFPGTDLVSWTRVEFNSKVVKEREGRRPLLTKGLNYTMRDTHSVTLGDIEFTDNSSWVRCQKFKLGARVVAETSGGGERILEALTDAFVVKDSRGEQYKKNYPPKLEDEVWRLEKIGKDGKFHQRLHQKGVHNVQDFLKMAVVNPTYLKTILGGKNGLSDRMWDAVLKHAMTCNLGNKLYIFNGPNHSILLDPICNILSIKIDGQTYPYPTSNTDLSFKKMVDDLVENAYRNWDSLKEVDRPVNATTQPPQGNLMRENENNNIFSNQKITTEGIIEVGETDEFTNHNDDLLIQFQDWQTSPNIF